MLGPSSQIVKARFLSPSDLGVVAVFMIVYGFARAIENAGIAQSIVQKDELGPSERFTVFVATLFVGVISSTVLFFSADVIQGVFRVSAAGGLLRAGAPLLLLAITDRYLRALLHRDLLFRGVALIETAKRVTYLVLLVLFLVIDLGPMSIVLALLGSTLLGGLALFRLAFNAGVLKFQTTLETSAVRHLWQFGVPIAIKQVFTYFTHRADEIVVATALAPEVLGFYHLAKETIHNFRILITRSFSRVLLSLFSRIRDDRERLTQIYHRISVLVSYAGMSAFLGLSLTAYELVPAVFGPQWSNAVFPFQALAVAAIPIVLTANVSTSLLFALGESKNAFLIDIGVNIPYLVVLFSFADHGLNGVLLAYVAYCFVKAGLFQIVSSSRLTSSATEHISVYVRPLLRVVVMSAIILLVRKLLPEFWGTGLHATVLVVSGFASMTLVTWVTDRPAIREFFMLVKPS